MAKIVAKRTAATRIRPTMASLFLNRRCITSRHWLCLRVIPSRDCM
ncbi:hypothetical protein [Hungatella sp.]